MQGKYDLLVDGGTMEHCFNIKEVLSNSVRLLKLGGYVHLINPTSGCIDHGFYQFSPTLFLDFFSANGFEEMEMNILVGNKYLINYDSNYLPCDYLGYDGLINFMAKKTKEVDEIRMPIQNYYTKMS